MLFLRFRALFLSLVLAGAACGADAPAKDDARPLAQQVHDIFEAKCIDCHGAVLPRP